MKYFILEGLGKGTKASSDELAKTLPSLLRTIYKVSCDCAILPGTEEK